MKTSRSHVLVSRRVAPRGRSRWRRRMHLCRVRREPVYDPAYRGVWASEDEYIREQIAELLPDSLRWLLACCDPVWLRAGYTAGTLRVWSRRAGYGRVYVFEAPEF